MTEFSLDPYKKCTVRSYMKYESVDAYARALTQNLMRGTGGRMGNFYWANGILFKHATFPPSDSLAKQYLEGNLPLDHIEYAVMPEFRNEIRVDDFVITILDVSNHTLFSALTKWIKETLEKKRK